MSIDFMPLIAFYCVGTLVGYFLCKYLSKDHDELLNFLIDNGFLRTSQDQEGNIIIKKWHDNRL